MHLTDSSLKEKDEYTPFTGFIYVSDDLSKQPFLTFTEIKDYKRFINSSKEELDYGYFIASDNQGIYEAMKGDEYNKEHVPSKNLPNGWIWNHYDDGSGHLQSPDGKSYFGYDLETGEVKPGLSYQSDWSDWNCSLNELVSKAETWIAENVIDQSELNVKKKTI